MRAILPISCRAALTALLFFGVAAADLSGQALDRTQRPAPAAQPPLELPGIEMRKLRNGIPVAVMQDHRLPVVSVSAILDIPSANDPAGKTGLRGFTAAMLSEGSTSRTAEELADAAAALGSSVGPTGFYTITANLDPALTLMAEQLLQPAFPEAALERIKANAIAGLRRQKENPGYLASTVFSNVVYGAGHPYSREATEETITAIGREDLVDFYRKYFAPPNVQFVVVGDITPEAAVAKLNEHFGRWKAGTSAKVEIPAPRGPGKTTIYLHDRPGSPQSVIMAGTLGPRRDTPDYHAIQIMNTVLGGAFSSRLNLNLREAHGYTYGARSGFGFRQVPEVSTFTAGAAVHTAKTDSALIELMREVREVRDSRPITDEEFAFAKAGATKELPLQFETVSQRAGAVAELVQDKLPLDYYETLSAKLRAVTLDQTRATAKRYVTPDQLAIVVVGDRAVIEEGLRAANIAPVVVVDLEGAPIAAK